MVDLEVIVSISFKYSRMEGLEGFNFIHSERNENLSVNAEKLSN